MAIRQNFKLRDYDWHIFVYYTVNEDYKREILDMLEGFRCDKEVMESVYKNMNEACEDTGFTYSNFKSRCSVMVIHKASSIGEFINTFEHEKNHLEMHMCEALNINPYSEDAAHMSGNLAQSILEEALSFIIEL